MDQNQFNPNQSLGNGKTDLLEQSELSETSAFQSVVVNINEGTAKRFCFELITISYLSFLNFPESDNESIPTPCKNFKSSSDAFKVKSLEELRLEQIQKQDAALYQYDLPAEEHQKV